MYLISYKMIYGVDLQRCVLQEIASLDKKETESPTLLRIWLSITLHDISMQIDTLIFSLGSLCHGVVF